MSLGSNELPPHTSVVGDLRSWIQNSLRVHVTYQLKRKKKIITFTKNITFFTFTNVSHAGPLALGPIFYHMQL